MRVHRWARGGVVGACALAGMSCSGPATPNQTPPASPAVLPAESPSAPAVEIWDFAGHPGKLIRTQSYRLFTTESDPVLVEQMPGFLEQALTHYTSAFGPLPKPRFKLDTFLMGDQEQWALLTKQLMGDQAATYLKIERGGFSSGGRAVLRGIGRRDTLAIAAHEGWHQYTQRTFGRPLPPWLEEGIAVYMEGFVVDPVEPGRFTFTGWANTERFDQLMSASARVGLAPLPALVYATPQELINTSTDATLTYYAQLWVLVHFLRDGEGGRYRKGLFTSLADAAAAPTQLAEGEVSPQVQAKRAVKFFERYFGTSPAEMQRGYERYLDLLLTDAARAKVARGEAPIDTRP